MERRLRTHRQSTGKRILPRDRDLELFQALYRHGPLSTSAGYELTKQHGKNRKKFIQRLATLFHESNTPHGGAYLERPWQQFQTHDARYQEIVSWLNSHSYQALRDHGMLPPGSPQTPPTLGKQFAHTFMAAHITSSIEIAAASQGVAFIPQPAVIAKMPVATRESEQPLAIPVSISHGFPKGQQRSTRPVVPDALFGLQHPAHGYRFFVLEADRSSEPLERTNLNQTSYLRKFLAWREVLRGAYKEQWGLPNLIVLNVFSNETHMRGAMKLLGKLATAKQWTRPFLFASIPHFDRWLKIPPPMPQLYGPYERVGFPPLDITDFTQ